MAVPKKRRSRMMVKTRRSTQKVKRVRYMKSCVKCGKYKTGITGCKCE